MTLVIIVVVVLLVAVIGWAVITYNGLIKLRNLVQEAWRQIDVELTRRHDLIGNLVETVKGYAAHERETFEAALKTGRHVLEALGVDPYRAREMADAFRHHNVAIMESLIPHFHDENLMLTVAQAGRAELEELFSCDREKFEEKGKGEDEEKGKED